jgi:hypothetical protein
MLIRFRLRLQRQLMPDRLYAKKEEGPLNSKYSPEISASFQ